MLQRISDFVQSECKRFARFATAAVVALSLGGSFPTFAQQPGQQTFASAQDAAQALLEILQSAARQIIGYPNSRAQTNEFVHQVAADKTGRTSHKRGAIL